LEQNKQAKRRNLDIDELLKRGLPFRGIFDHIWCGRSIHWRLQLPCV